MTKTEFLADDNVREMVVWLRTRLQSDFPHRYTNRLTDEPWSCDGLFDAFRQYRWPTPKEGWRKNKDKLDAYRGRMRAALASDDTDELVDACQEVLLWGGVSANNGRYVREHRDVLHDELRCLSNVLTADREPAKSDICLDPKDPATECQMNAGFVKIYSVLLDHFVIYDGRVGAALGLLVRTFCEQSGRQTIPPALAFAYGTPKEDARAERPKLRNPSVGQYRFPRLSANSHAHCVQAMRASWFLRETLDANGHPFSKGEDGFHELGAALFMVGYDLSESQR